MDRTRKCIDCGERKAIGEFPISSWAKPPGWRDYPRRRICKPCAQRMAKRDYNHRNRNLRNGAKRENRQQRREEERQREQLLGYKRGTKSYARSQTDSDRAEIIAMEIVDILDVPSDAINEMTWEKLCVYLGGNVLVDSDAVRDVANGVRE